MSHFSLGRAMCAMSFIALSSSAAMAQSVQVGTLLCHVSGGVGMIIMENQALDCVYTDAKGSPPQHYIGRLTNVGANIGISGPGQMIWSGSRGHQQRGAWRAGRRLCRRGRVGRRRRRRRRRGPCRRLQQDHLAAARVRFPWHRPQCFRRPRQCQPAIYAGDPAAAAPRAGRQAEENPRASVISDDATDRKTGAPLARPFFCARDLLRVRRSEIGELFQSVGMRLQPIRRDVALREKGQPEIDDIVGEGAAIGIARGLGWIEAQHIG